MSPRSACMHFVKPAGEFLRLEIPEYRQPCEAARTFVHAFPSNCVSSLRNPRCRDHKRLRRQSASAALIKQLTHDGFAFPGHDPHMENLVYGSICRGDRYCVKRIALIDVAFEDGDKRLRLSGNVRFFELKY